MSTLKFQDYELPITLCQVIRRLSLKGIGLYKGDDHEFLPPILNPKENDMHKIKVEYEKFPSLQDVNFNALVQFVNRNTTVTPIVQSVQSIHTGTGDSTALKKLQHIELLEEGNGTPMHLLYLEKNRFLVLRSARSTILTGDILQANSLPISVGEQELFTIIRDGKEFIPEEYTRYGVSPSFHTKEILQIKLCSSPDIYKIIDEDERYGEGVVLEKKLSEKNVVALIAAIKKVLEKTKGALPNCEYFPDYSALLTLAKSGGIDCYTLNLLIECCECLRFDKVEYGFCDEDWELSDLDKAALAKEIERKNRAKYNKKLSEFKSAIKSIQTRRVMIFFKAAGRVSDMAYITGLENELDTFADQGFGTKGWARQQRLDAIANSKPKPGENIITAGKLIATLAVVITIGWVWFISNRNMDTFNYKIERADRILAQGSYVEARDAYRAAYEEYRPKVTAIFVRPKMKERIKKLDEALNKEIEDGIDQINTMRIADGNKFSDESEELLYRLLDLAPNDSRLLEMRTELINQ